MSDTAVLSPQRTVGDIDIDCTIEEVHSDELTVTAHPVERGAQISDHAFANPMQLVMRMGWSNSSEAAGGDEGYINDRYAKLLTLQKSRELFDIVTTKRSYEDMLCLSLAVTTDQETGAVLMVTGIFREVILVETYTTPVPPAADHATPEATAPTQETGTKQLAPATLSPAP